MKTLFVCSLLAYLPLATLADPTQPAAAWLAKQADQSEPATPAELKLQLIKQSSAGWVALINGELVQTGQKVQQYRVLTIKPDQVILEKEGKRQILPLINTAIKQYE